jgi:hypothetical protein
MCDPKNGSKSCSEENAMHGQIGGLNYRMQTGGDLDFYYRTRAALLEARGFGNGIIDYDYYRARARTERRRVLRAAFKSLGRFLRSLFAVAVIAAAIWTMPMQAKDCAICEPHGQTFTAAR